jgi:hypothetical protein
MTPFSYQLRNRSYTAILAVVTIISVVAILLLGYYRGLNSLIPLAVLSLVAGVLYRDKGILRIAVGIAVAYVVLSSVTIAPSSN